MIRVRYRRKDHRLTLQGHAYSGEPGHDPVCASASILVWTLAAAVDALAAAEQVTAPELRLEAGDAAVSCKAPRRFEAPVTLIFDTICAGFALLAKNYPDNICYRIEKDRRDGL